MSSRITAQRTGTGGTGASKLPDLPGRIFKDTAVVVLDSFLNALLVMSPECCGFHSCNHTKLKKSHKDGKVAEMANYEVPV